MFAFAVMRMPRMSSAPTTRTTPSAKTFTEPPSPGGAVIASGSVTPKTWSSSEFR
jgi:hypothetical protein